MFVPDRGATDTEIAAAFDGRCSGSLAKLLRRWNGLDLDVIRIHAVGDSVDSLPTVADSCHGTVIASDPSGFRYVQLPDGSISSLDHDGGTLVSVAIDFDDFIGNYIFGNRAAEFCGDEWAADVASSLA
ncbi:hypothetical protein [Stieleria varia]|uniref:hypothetical protein n=1 Tax=Stieleria varia TaxID=2528005 RepID=UPI0011B68A7C|nr:hypothetical protein [Stieleria varia]